MARIRVVVTAEDVARGRSSATRCPLARAIRRATKERPVAVFTDSYQAGDRPEYPLTTAAEVFVGAFDRGFLSDWDWPSLTFYLEGPDR